jgi:hypothetical protein
MPPQSSRPYDRGLKQRHVLCNSQADRLFTKDMLSGLGCHNGPWNVEMVGQGGYK